MSEEIRQRLEHFIAERQRQNARILEADHLGICRFFNLDEAAYRDGALGTVRGLGLFLAALAATLVAPHLLRLLRFRQTFRDIGLRSGLAAIRAVGFKIHRAVFDPIFLKLGRVDRLLKLRR